MIHTQKIQNFYTSELLEFYKECDYLGYKNNSSYEAMQITDKIDPHFWCVKLNSKIVSFSGCHYWLDQNGIKAVMRCLIRSATLPSYTHLISGLSKNHMNSIPFSIILPYQISFGIKNNINVFYITTSNSTHDNSGKMTRTHKILKYLCNKKIVSHISDEIIYSTAQTKWQINLENYYAALKVFHPTREKLQIDLSEEYYKIIEHGF